MRIFVIPEIYFLMFCFNLTTDNYFDYTLSAPLSVYFPLHMGFGICNSGKSLAISV